ncbi:hypothetical protein [Curtobacterium sp. MCBD17_019]|uniref:hypothetical protein n=1 Tax=Curtobacterium sp. MCBD17_019 TaxID=2175669 RepID=UPI0011B3F5C5|nr:hypothetical protein [Curtobacterium sp. MCBD17_019]
MTYSSPITFFAAQPAPQSLDPALWGFYGVLVGAVISLVGSVAVPWIRDSMDRRRQRAELEYAERREWLMNSIAALLDYRQAQGARQGQGPALAAVGTAMNQLRARLKPEEEDVAHVLLVMLAMIQEPRPGVPNMVGQAMTSLVNWVRGDVRTEDLVADVERRAHIKFSDDRSSAEPASPAS